MANPLTPIPIPNFYGTGLSYPADLHNWIVSNKWALAQDWFEKAFAFGDETKAEVGEAPQVPVPDLRTLLEQATPPSNLQFDDPDSAMEYYNSKNAELSALVDDAFNKMVGIAFPDMDVFADALRWCRKAINEGGTGININVEHALWERGRARILEQAQRDTQDITEKYARAGWPLPPGAMFHAQQLIRQESRNKLAEQSRDIAIKSFDTEIENVRFAIKTVGDLFSQALQAVSDYVKTIMLAPQTAASLTSSLSNMKNDAARTLVTLYQAQNAALEPFLKIEMTDAELKSRAQEQNLRAKMEVAKLKLDATLANLKMVGDAAASSLNGISAGTSLGISAGD